MDFVPLTTDERAAMLATLGLDTTDALFQVIPEAVRGDEIDVGAPLTEIEVTGRVEELAAVNRPVAGGPFFLGAGAYRHFIPAAVGAILGRSEFSTSYTPYQPEVSQGTLQASFEFQSMVCALTAMDVSNASVYDGASATAEAALMAMRLTRRDRIVVSGSVHPHYRDVVAAYVQARDVEIVTTGVHGSPSSSNGSAVVSEDDLTALLDERTACCIVSQPTLFGEVRDLGQLVQRAHQVGALVVEVYNPTSLGLLRPPGDWGVDIAVAEGQPLGIPLSFGGPYVGLMSCRRDLVRQMPGRIVGQTTDSQGRRGYVLTLQAREQHIRREKATSNICTSQTLIALGVTSYLALLGPRGLGSVAEACWQMAHYTAEQVARLPGVSVITPSPFFHEFAVRTPVPAAELNRALVARGVVGGYDLGPAYPELSDAVLFCCTEATTRRQVEILVSTLNGILVSAREPSGSQPGRGA